MYTSILLSLVAVISGSQQLLVLPKERRQYTRDGTGGSQPLAQQVVLDPSNRLENELDEAEKNHLHEIAIRFRNVRYNNNPNFLQVFALQTPIMLLAFAAAAFLAGLCSVVFAPLAKNPMWDDNAKVRNLSVSTERSLTYWLTQIAVVFGIAGVFCVAVFFPTSFMVHGLFSMYRDDRSRVGSYLARVKA